MANHHRQACRNMPGACEGVRHSARIAQAARKIPHADDSPDHATTKRRPQTKIALKEEPPNPPPSGLLLCPCPKRLREPTAFSHATGPFPRCNINIWSRTATSAYRSKLPCLPRFRKKFCLSAPCFRPFSCIDIDTRNVYDYILNFVEQFQHITRQICSPIAARP